MDSDPVFIHFDFEDYKPVLMSKNQESFYLYRMCPPNSKVHYFFSNPLLDVQLIAKD
jgi:hypothetical protein